MLVFDIAGRYLACAAIAFVGPLDVEDGGLIREVHRMPFIRKDLLAGYPLIVLSLCPEAVPLFFFSLAFFFLLRVGRKEVAYKVEQLYIPP